MRTPSYKIGTFENERDLAKAVKQWSGEGYRIEHLNTALAAEIPSYGKLKTQTLFTLAMVRWPDFVSELCGEEDPRRGGFCDEIKDHPGSHKVRGWDG